MDQQPFSPNSLASNSPTLTKTASLFVLDSKIDSLKTRNSFSTFGIYSKSGYDLVGILARLANRPNPTIRIGPIDLKCSFVICDAKLPDQPIIYASETFEKYIYIYITLKLPTNYSYY